LGRKCIIEILLLEDDGKIKKDFQMKKYNEIYTWEEDGSMT
jgi:hypothetical protein